MIYTSHGKNGWQWRGMLVNGIREGVSHLWAGNDHVNHDLAANSLLAPFIKLGKWNGQEGSL